MKYIIEIEDAPFESEGSETELYKATEFNSLVFDKIGLDKLTPYVPAVDFESGCETGWMFARAIASLEDDEIDKAFNLSGMSTRPIVEVINCLSFAEACDKYDAWQKQKNEIHVGDEVASNYEEGIRFAVTRVRNGSMDGINFANGESYTYRSFKQWHKTGRNFPELIELIEKMKENA